MKALYLLGLGCLEGAVRVGLPGSDTDTLSVSEKMDKGECTSTPSAHAQILVSSSLQHFHVRDYVYFIILLF